VHLPGASPPGGHPILLIYRIDNVRDTQTIHNRARPWQLQLDHVMQQLDKKPKQRGLSSLPCLVPEVVRMGSPSDPSTATLQHTVSYNFTSRSKNRPWIPSSWHLSNNKSLRTLSNALLKSTNTTYNRCLLCWAEWIRCCKVKMASKVPWPGLKPHCVGERSPSLDTTASSLLFNRRSNDRENS